MSKTMDDITAINKLVDYRKYFSYSDVLCAISRGEIEFELPKIQYTTHKCSYCDEPVPEERGASQCCSRGCQAKWVRLDYRKAGKTEKRTGKPPYQLWAHVQHILPYWNNGLSDKSISVILEMQERYIGRIRRYFGIPANYGAIPYPQLTFEDIKENVPVDIRIRKYIEELTNGI